VLAEHFMQRYAAQYGKRIAPLGPAQLETLKRYRWPGNVRELENLVRRLAALYPQETITGPVIEAELDTLPLATPAAAQRIVPGFSRSDQSDVTGVSVTSADMLGLEPGVAKSYTCPVAWGVRNAAVTVAAELSGERLRPTLVAAPAIGSAVQADLGSVLAGQDDDQA